MNKKQDNTAAHAAPRPLPENHTANKGGSPPKSADEKRDKRKYVYLTQSEFDSVNDFCDENNYSDSDFFRDMAFKGKVVAAVTEGEGRLMRSLAGMANNLNQIAHRANRDGFGAHVREIVEIRDRIANVIINTQQK